MEKEKFERAKMLRCRIQDLENMERGLSTIGDVFISNVKGDYSPNRLSHDMKIVLLGMCIGEKTKYQKEFDEL